MMPLILKMLLENNLIKGNYEDVKLEYEILINAIASNRKDENIPVKYDLTHEGHKYMHDMDQGIRYGIADKIVSICLILGLDVETIENMNIYIPFGYDNESWLEGDEELILCNFEKNGNYYEVFDDGETMGQFLWPNE